MGPLLSLRGVTRRFPGVLALDNVSLDLHAGEVLALVGENGAGKSTLVNLLAGALQPDAGTISLEGTPVRFATPADALRAGIGVVYQDRRLVPDLTVEENILLGHEPVTGPGGFLRRDLMRDAARAALARLDSTLDPGTPAHRLGPAGAQITAIARALTYRLRVLILDEPTAPLTRREADALFSVIRRLTGEGVALLYISHRLEDVAHIAGRIAVLRDGALVHCGPAADLDRPRLISLMVGRTLEQEFPPRTARPGADLLTVNGLTTHALRGVDLTVRRGDVVGVAGLSGAGRTSLALAIAGADRVTGGTMLLDGHTYAPRSPAESIAAGVALLTEDRNATGLFMNLNIRENISLPSLSAFLRGPLLDLRAEARAASDAALPLRIKAPSGEHPVTALSGGNRQKVVLARWLLRRASLLIFDEPTAGVDVGARSELYRHIDLLAAGGKGVLVLSSDLEELRGICSRIAVLREGRLAGMLEGPAATAGRILDLATPPGAAA